MKIMRYAFLFLTSAAILASCNDDDDEGPPAQTSFPVSLAFSEVRDTEFRMWTDGAEISTTGLDVAEYMDPEDWAELNPEYFSQAGITLTFDEDSIYGVNTEENEMESYAYFIRNDSIFLDVNYVFFGDTLEEVFFANGDFNELFLNQGYYEYCNNGEFITTCESNLVQEIIEESDLEEELGNEDWVQSIDENDTLIVYNQRVIYN